MLPPVPSWEAAHPIIVHFPIALLLCVPVFIVLAMLGGKRSGALAFAALVVMALGAGAAVLAVMSGEAAEELVAPTPEIEEALERHEELAELTRTLFLAIAGLFAGVLLALKTGPERLTKRLRLPLMLLTLVLTLGAGAVLANTAHAGGILVHDLGVRAPLDGEGDNARIAPADSSSTGGSEEGEEEDSR